MNAQEIEEFESWFCDYFEIDVTVLIVSRWIDDDGDVGYRGIGFTDESDTMATMALQAWLARAGKEPPK